MKKLSEQLAPKMEKRIGKQLMRKINIKKLFRDNRHPLAVVTTVTDWNEPPRFRHQVTRQLIRFYNVLYVERSKPISWKDWFRGSYETINGKLVVYRPPRLPHGMNRLYAYFPIFHTIIDIATQKIIENTIKMAGYKKAVLVNFQFDFYVIMNSIVFSPKIYLCNDEFPKTARFLWQQKLFTKYENRVVSKANCCVTPSKPLLEKFKKINKKVYKLLPGHEFRTTKTPTYIIKKRQSSKIAVCYMGFIDNRLKIDWMLKLLSQRDLEIYLIGPVVSSQNVVKLIESPMVKHIPPIVGVELQSFLLQMNVCIIPYDLTLEVVKACSPNKIFQYIACGKPVVISNMSQIEPFPEKFVYIANDELEFIDRIRQAQSENNDYLVDKRMKFAIKNSWDARGNELQKIINSFTFNSMACE